MLNATYYMTLFLLYHSSFQPSLEDIFADYFESRAYHFTCGSMNDFDEEENGKQISEKTLNSIFANVYTYLKTPNTVLLLVIKLFSTDQ